MYKFIVKLNRMKLPIGYVYCYCCFVLLLVVSKIVVLEFHFFYDLVNKYYLLILASLL